MAPVNSPPPARPSITDYDLDHILISAVRHAKGRSPHVWEQTGRVVREQARWITPGARGIIVGDLEWELGLCPDGEFPDLAGMRQDMRDTITTLTEADRP